MCVDEVYESVAIGEVSYLVCESPEIGRKYKICQYSNGKVEFSSEISECKKACETDGDWKATAINTEAFILCPLNQVGVITRYCFDELESATGKWGNKSDTSTCFPSLNEVIPNTPYTISFTISFKNISSQLVRSQLMDLYSVVAQALNVKYSSLFMSTNNKNLDVKVLYYSEISIEELNDYFLTGNILTQLHAIDGLSGCTIEISGLGIKNNNSKKSDNKTNIYIISAVCVFFGLSCIIIGVIFFVSKSKNKVV